MPDKKIERISFFQKYLTIWVALCMIGGILIGKVLPAIPQYLNKFEYAKVSIPVAILIWLMIYPMMMKVDFQSVKDVGKPKRSLCNLGSQLAYKTFYYVWNSSFFLSYFV